MNTDLDDINQFVEENHDAIVRVLRHSANETARAYAWALLDYAYDAPELDALHDELDALEREVSA